MKDTIAQNTMQLVTVEKGQPVDTILNMNKVEETQTDELQRNDLQRLVAKLLCSETTGYPCEDLLSK